MGTKLDKPEHLWVVCDSPGEGGLPYKTVGWERTEALARALANGRPVVELTLRDDGQYRDFNEDANRAPSSTRLAGSRSRT